MVIVNQSSCVNVSLDLSEASTRYSTHPVVLAVSGTAMCLLSAFIVGSNITVIGLVVYSRYHRKYINRTEKQDGFSSTKQMLSISLSAVHLIVGAFCVPLAMVQVIGNGKWTLGQTFCTARTLLEFLTEIVRICHSMCLAIDNYAMVRKPLKYKLLTSRSGYVSVLFCWSVPLSVFVIALALGWHTEGIEASLSCLQEHQMCIALLGRKFLLIILPSAICLSFGLLVAMATITLKEIQRLHQRRMVQNKTTRNNTEQSQVEDAKRSRSSQKAYFGQNNFIAEQTEPEQSNFGECNFTRRNYYLAEKVEAYASTISNGLISLEKEVSENNPHMRMEDKTSPPVKAKSSFKRKAYGLVITLITIHCLYLAASLVVNTLFVFKTGLFPLWLFSLLTYFRYIHVAMVPVFVFRHQYFRNQWRSFVTTRSNTQ